MLKLIVIARRFDDLEYKLLLKNCARIRRVFGRFSGAYILNEKGKHNFGAMNIKEFRFLHVLNDKAEQNAALSRAIGYHALNIAKDDLVLFLDGDMLITQAYLRFLKNTPPVSLLIQSPRMDIRFDAAKGKRRYLKFAKNADGRFGALYGSMALRGIDFLTYNLMTHDMEEQWFLHQLSAHPAAHMAYPHTGILHFDRFSGVCRWARLIKGPRGVGIWQGLSLMGSYREIASGFCFFVKRKNTIRQRLKFVILSALSLPKFFSYRMPKRLLYEEISDDLSNHPTKRDKKGRKML